jgi:site-specific recombinase XerD
MIGKLLGHSQPATTMRYAHLAADPMRDLNAKVGDTLGASLKSPKAKA